MKYQLLALLTTIVLNSLASGKVIRSDAPANLNRGLRMLSDKETSLFAGVIYEQDSEGESERAIKLREVQPVFDENIAAQIAESELDEEVESQLDEYATDSANYQQPRKRDVTKANANKRHPVILVPGLGGSTILGHHTGVNAAQGRTRTLWVGLHMIADMKMSRYPLALKYDAELNEFNNEITNLNTTIRDFGGVNGMKIIDAGVFAKMKAVQRIYLEDVVESLETRGYRIGQDLRGAPYDFRRIGDQKVRTQFYKDLQKLIEDTYEMNGQTRVHLTGHSLGGILSMNFLNTFMGDNQTWKDKYIESYTSVAAPFLGAPKALKTMLSGDNLGIKLMNEAYLAQLTSSFSCMLWMMPHVHSDKQAITPRSAINNFISVGEQTYNNTQPAIADLFSKFKRDSNLMTAFEKQIFPLYNMSHPKVNINCIYGYNVATEINYDYKTAHAQPLITYGNGDGTVPLESLQFCEQWGAEDENYTLNIREFEHASHGGILSHAGFLRYFTDIAHPKN